MAPLKSVFVALFFVFLFSPLFAFVNNDLPDKEEEISEELLLMFYHEYLDSIEQSLAFETGLVTLDNGIASIHLPKGFRYLNGEDSEMILTDLWGNPPGDPDFPLLGMLMPEDGPFSESSYVITIMYIEDGYVKDADARSIDYDDLLRSMQESTEEGNAERISLGYETVELIGWASQPYYDFEAKKLHWAKELRFGEEEESTLNYNIRILGRKGYLRLNVIGDMETLARLEGDLDPLLSSINFNEGHRYTDFNPKLDNVAAYGVGALIAGKVAAKAGLFAKLGILLAKSWKFLLLGLVAAGGAIRAMFGGK